MVTSETDGRKRFLVVPNLLIQEEERHPEFLKMTQYCGVNDLTGVNVSLAEYFKAPAVLTR